MICSTFFLIFSALIFAHLSHTQLASQDESKQYISQNPCSDYLKKALFFACARFKLDRLLNFPWNLKKRNSKWQKNMCVFRRVSIRDHILPRF